ncbi:hypothetical protein N9O13_03670 [Crocinitomicaceae bacterium]|nr:hypothetical protein [Crocinitomicaceae bacterium]MDC1244322.1 hypothetical protein [Crocinitomicaceae bacterium]MDO7613018.1 hypothetical protein [Crocinitomicaceae bacterium]
MKLILLTFFISFSICSNAQIKKRDQGVYKGLISSYEINTGQNLIEVDSSEIFIKIENSSFTIKIDNVQYEGTYEVEKREKRNYVLKAKTDYSDIKEEIILFGRDKIMKRKGIFPQPDSILKKLKKKEVLW